MQIHTVETPELGDRSYVVDDGSVAVVIDPQRDLDRLEPVLAHSPAYVLETHIHNDYLTGGLELARRTGAAYGVHAADEVAFDRLPLSDGEVLQTGNLEITVLATPGHTPTHLSYVVRDLADPLAGPAVFSGGSLLYGTVGRTDLIDPASTRELAHAQLRSVRRLGALPVDATLHPTHGFGSFCAGGNADVASASTIGEEREKNPALLVSDAEKYVAGLVASFGAYPSYYRHMAGQNRRGPTASALELPPRRARADELTRLLEHGTVVDLRSAAEFAADHLGRSVSVPLGLQFATYVGWLTPWEGPLAVVAPDVDRIEQARRQLTRIGIDEILAAWGSLDEVVPSAPRSSYRRATFDDLGAEAGPDDVVLDVRRLEEYDDDHVRGARHLPVHEVERRSGEVPRGARTWVYCAGGFRAGTACSLLHRDGIDVIHVDDDYPRAVELGLTVGH